MISYLSYLLIERIYTLLGIPSPFTPSTPTQTLSVGTRDSLLALAQTDIVISALLRNHPHLRTTTTSLKTQGDKNLKQALYSIPAKSLWTEELESLLQARSVDLIVHSLKDMPTTLPEKCELGCILQREDPRDALVFSSWFKTSHPTAKSLADLPEGAIVRTSSLRRIAQIKRRYPHLVIKDMRGNIISRLRKADDRENEFSAIILAAAGLHRLDLQNRITKYLEAPEMLHAVGQGAIGVEIRNGDDELRRLLEPLRCAKTSMACKAERALLRRLEGGCSVPIGVQTSWEGEEMRIMAAVISPDGKRAVEVENRRVVREDERAEEFGVYVAEMLIEEGAQPILDEVNSERREKEPLKEDEL